MRVAVAMVVASHPVPTGAVTALAVVLAAGVGAAGPTVSLIGLAVLTGQLSVGWSNDWIDAERDRVAGRRDKPAVTGAVTPAQLRGAAWGAAAACVVASLATGLRPGLLHVAAVASAWGYNAGLKRTAGSWLPYAVSFGLLTAFVVVAAGGTVPVVLVAAGSLLGTGAHVLNVLPDLDDDDATGVRGLPHRMGRRGSAVAAPTVLAAAVVLVALGAVGRSGTVVAAAVLGGAVAVLAGVLAVVRPTSRVPFVLSMAVAAACVALMVTAGPDLA